MSLYDQIVSHKEKISVLGLGYVGLPIAVAFSKKASVIGFDLNKEKINLYKAGIDPTGEVGNEAIQKSNIEYTYDEKKLRDAKFHIICVPTPVHPDNTPDLSLIENASKIVGNHLTKGSVVVYESTVYPGVTEDICTPILEESGLKCGIDFKVGYSPERINPGDKLHRLENIVKVVSGMDDESLELIAKIYELVIKAGIYKAESIKIAEAAKVIENSQRDINIAFMNELSIIFNKMGINTKSVLDTAETKWNFLNFTPGLVGGHCIGVDPYYLTYKAEQLGYHSQIILAGRKINDAMGKYVAENLVKKIISAGISVKNANVAILGVTFKENCPDIRNTKIMDIIKELHEYGIRPVISDPLANDKDASDEYKINLTDIKEIENMDAVILAVAHNEYKSLSIESLNNLYKKDIQKKILLDLKNLIDHQQAKQAGYLYWSL